MHVATDQDENGGDNHTIASRPAGAAVIAGEEDVMTMLEDAEIDALFGNADNLVLQCLPRGQGEDSDGRTYGDGEVTECNPGNSNSGDEITRDEIMDNELENSFDELFEEPAWPSPPVAQNALPASPLQHPTIPELDLPTVMANISMLKNSIISNHLLLTRFLNLQSNYRSLSVRLTDERHLNAQAQLTINNMREEIASMSHDSTFLQSQTTQLKEELQKECSTRTTSESTVTKYKEEIKGLKKQIDTLKKDKGSAERRLAESLKELDVLKIKVVTLMSENRSFVNQIIQLEKQELAQDKSKLQEEVISLQNKVARLEALNIRLRAGRSTLVGGEGNTLADFQSLRPGIRATTQPTTASPPQSPMPQPRPRGSTVPTALGSSDDEVIFMGTNLSSISPFSASSSLVTPIIDSMCQPIPSSAPTKISPCLGDNNTVAPDASAAASRSPPTISSSGDDGEIL